VLAVSPRQENLVSDNSLSNNSGDSADTLRRALQAVQTALDRRDNGGDAGTQSD
jgi:hypothetical protein